MNASTGLHRIAAVSLLLGAVVNALGDDETVTGNLTVTGNALVGGTLETTGNATIGGTIDAQGNSFTFGTHNGSFGVGAFFLPSGSDGVTWHLARISAWLWEVSDGSTTSPAMRLDASNNLLLYSGGTVGLALNPGSKSLALGDATLAANGTALITNGAFTAGGALNATTFTATSGTITGGDTGLILNAGGTNQNITLAPSGSGIVTIPSRVAVTNTTASSSSAAGALTVSGGVGVAGALNVGQSVTSSLVATDLPVAGAFRAGLGAGSTLDVLTAGSSGGRSVALRAYQDGGGTATWQFGHLNNTATTFTETLRVNTVGGNLSSSGVLVFATQPSSSTTTGALTIVGGLGVSGGAHFGGNVGVGINGATARLHVAGSDASSSASALTVANSSGSMWSFRNDRLLIAPNASSGIHWNLQAATDNSRSLIRFGNTPNSAGPM